MSSTISAPRTPPDPYSDDAVQVACSLPAYTHLGEDPAVGELRVDVNEEDADGKGTVEGSLNNGGRKDATLDSLLLAAALASGPHITRHHYHHSFFPRAEAIQSHCWKYSDGQEIISQQVPRFSLEGPSEISSSEASSTRASSVSPYLKATDDDDVNALLSPICSTEDVSLAASVLSSPGPTHSSEYILGEDCVISAHTVARPTTNEANVHVKCMVRTRIPTVHGEVFLHLYHNDRDNKEHLAIVVDPAQLNFTDGTCSQAPFIRSKSLDEVWDEAETPMDRAIRGAYVGRLNQGNIAVEKPSGLQTEPSNASVPAPLVRIHSECFTGETIGSMRCDCGEQLDEALRRMFQPITFTDEATGEQVTVPGRGAVIYMRQEGRGIGLLSKLRAYNLQDLGHDTVQANLLLGHGADERGYEVAAAIMHDLGLGAGDGRSGESVRLLTNNPDKVQKLKAAGVDILEQVSMVPRSWRCQAEGIKMEDGTDICFNDNAVRLRSQDTTSIGAGVVHGPELEKYLRTKVLRMGHMLSLPPSGISHE